MRWVEEKTEGMHPFRRRIIRAANGDKDVYKNLIDDAAGNRDVIYDIERSIAKEQKRIIKYGLPSEAMLWEFAESPKMGLRKAVAESSRTPKEILLILLEDDSYLVRNEAKWNLETRHNWTSKSEQDL